MNDELTDINEDLDLTIDLPEGVTEAVGRGAAWLDEIVPDWVADIDLSSLDLGSPYSCVLGQLGKALDWKEDLVASPYGAFVECRDDRPAAQDLDHPDLACFLALFKGTGVHRMSKDLATDRGFEVGDNSDWDYEHLDVAWHRLILGRRGVDLAQLNLMATIRRLRRENAALQFRLDAINRSLSTAITFLEDDE